jgi:hypothetical protein
MKSKVITPAQFRAIAANVRAAERALATMDSPATSNDPAGLVVAANASLFTEAFFSEPLTTYSVGFKDNAALEAELDFIAPPVSVPRKFEYATGANAEEFTVETDDVRALGADFKDVTYTGDKVVGKTANRGLQITIDLDEVADKGNWREAAVAKLIRRSKRNDLYRAKVLLSAAATNTAKTWDTTAGKDPDQDVISELVTAADLTGLKPNRVMYGDTAWSKRALAHRAQSTAGGFGSASLTEEQIAGLLGVEAVMHSNARYSSSATARTGILGNLVLMFFASANADVDDGSNIKRFWTPTESGTEIRVYEQQISAKRYVIAVERYNLLKITHTAGIRQFTVS